MAPAKEPQNQQQIDSYQSNGPVCMGPWTSHIYRSDPKHMVFLLSRYKFCAKMLSGPRRILEVGCGDAFGLPVVRQAVLSVHGVDFEPLVIQDNQRRFGAEGLANVSFATHDMTQHPLDECFDGAYSLDVIEHVPVEREDMFMSNLCESLREDAVFVIGTPNITSSPYASPASREGHINLKSAASLADLLAKYFINTFSFSMNDEVVHTGFAPMANYLLCVCAGLRK